MSLVEQFGPHLPFLRRYARALTGSQQSGDAYIRAALTAIVADASIIDYEGGPRISLYRAVHAIWSTTGAELDQPAQPQSSVERRLGRLAPLHRQAFLPTALEGFTLGEAAQILGSDASSIAELVAHSQSEIERQLATRVLIIEDEPIIAADLEGLVSELGHEVTGNATTRKEAVEMARRDNPGLILCDIQLADNSSGIDAAHDILNELDVPIIFITAFPERLLTGERPEPTFLIAKPFQEAHVKAVIAQALFFHPDTAETVA